MAPGQWIGREDVKKLLGVTDDRALAAILKEHKLQSKRGPGNVGLWPRGRVLQIARTRAMRAAKVEEAKREIVAKKNGVKRATLPSVDNIASAGQITACAFKLFAEQKDLTDVAIELEITGEEVEELFITWWRLKQRTQEWQRPVGVPAVVASPSPKPATVSSVEPAPAPSAIPAPAVGVAAIKCEGEREDGLCCPAHFLQKNKAANG